MGEPRQLHSGLAADGSWKQRSRSRQRQKQKQKQKGSGRDSADSSCWRLVWRGLQDHFRAWCRVGWRRRLAVASQNSKHEACAAPCSAVDRPGSLERQVGRASSTTWTGLDAGAISRPVSRATERTAAVEKLCTRRKGEGRAAECPEGSVGPHASLSYGCVGF